MLAASVHYPIRGAVTFKGPVGVNVASDALANLASSGVTGGALVIVGEDYGEGSSIMQERSHAFAMKSQIWLLDPRPNLPSIVKAVGDGFALSEASNSPGDADRADPRLPCHGDLHRARQQCARRCRWRTRSRSRGRTSARVVLPPASYVHERDKIDNRWPAALRFISAEGPERDLRARRCTMSASSCRAACTTP